MNNPGGGTGFAFGTPASTGSIAFGTTATDAAKTQAAPLLFGANPTTAAGSAGLSFGASAGTGIGGAGLQTATPTPFTGFGTSAAPANVTAPPVGAFSLPSATSAAAPAAATTVPTLSFSLPTPAATTTASGFSGFRVPSTTTTSSSLLTMTGSTVQPAAVNLNTATVTTASAQQNPAAQLNLCQLEEHINKWTLELEAQEKVFTNKATEINAWDRILTENAKKIVSLHESVENVTTEQKVLEHELEIIAAQHSELEECLKPLENELAKIVQVDGERAQAYMLAENLDTQLKQMSEDLKEVIEHLNEANKERDPNDPIVQIGKILNAHMGSLQWIESSTSAIASNLEEIPKLMDAIKRDNDRSAWTK
ncbi:Nuclear pore glycoprotein p62 [Sergentomyia squamirostris]